MNRTDDGEIGSEALFEAIDAARRAGADHVEVRAVDERTERLAARNGTADLASADRQQGIGIRVRIGNAWGFASVGATSIAGAVDGARRATEIAREGARLARGEHAAPVEAEAACGRYETRLSIDPFKIAIDEKIALLIGATAALGAGRGAIRLAEARMQWTALRKRLVTSAGVDVDQRFVYGGVGMSCVAVGDDGVVQRRSHPTSFDGGVWQGGYEGIAPLDLVGSAEGMRDETLALLRAPVLPAGSRTVILEGSQLALQVHESCGHAVELDRALGTEVSLAGGSFLEPSMLGRFRYGARGVNLTADATCEGGLGTFGWDDEGVPAGRTPLVRDGIFVGYLSSRETAARIGVKSSGSMRASGYARLPLIRMVNVNLEPDPHGPSLEELIADTDDGVLLSTNRSWSIDDLRLNFQFGCEIAWEIKRGRRTRILRNPVYTGVTPEFWGRCDAICNPREWHLWGLTNCGKGEPMQLMPVGHGVSPARFRDVEVGHG